VVSWGYGDLISVWLTSVDWLFYLGSVVAWRTGSHHLLSLTAMAWRVVGAHTE
jgi:hypothetical protein